VLTSIALFALGLIVAVGVVYPANSEYRRMRDQENRLLEEKKAALEEERLQTLARELQKTRSWCGGSCSAGLRAPGAEIIRPTTRPATTPPK
jgi:hypothetical protein